MTKPPFPHIYWRMSFVVTTWTLLVTGSLAWNLRGLRQETLHLAYQNAATNIQHDTQFRSWVASHGGVYVEPSPATQPNPYLANVPDRDIVSTSGKKLTLMNPAYVVREIQTLNNKKGGELERVVSLKPLNPVNTPDDWERQALQQFEAGVPEVTEVSSIEGQPYFRMIRPFLTRKDCLTCHAKQGYKEGDIRGGISISIPLRKMYDAEASSIHRLSGGYASIWLFGLVGIVFYNRRILAREQERDALQQELERQAHTDPLTGLANRRAFLNTTEQELARTQRYGGELSLLMMDIDWFKKINDTYGHDAGDIVLKKMSAVCLTELRDVDTMGRFGGEEFTILLPQTDATHATRIAERLRSVIAETVMSDSPQISITVSIGIAAHSSEINNVDKLLNAADVALYAAKRAGRNQVYPPQ